jgi:cellulose synthase/poly-beta-1,6-N-acetylglucosamine synthase-like glycosyltransferase
VIADILAQAWHTLLLLLLSPVQQGLEIFILKFVPFVLFLEMPVYLLIILGILKYYSRILSPAEENPAFLPSVSCIITCYSEGKDVQLTIRSLCEQLYRGRIEVIPVIDGAHQNKNTYQAAREMEVYFRGKSNRILRILPKWQRGGRVSTLNSGLQCATGEIVMALDGDTSFDNDMVYRATRQFQDPNVVGVAGSLRARNVNKSLVTRLQAIEYLISIHAGRVGLSEFNIVNNISGAFGIFRKSFIQKLGGWDSGTAEDLDMTLRIKNYFARHPKLRIRFEPGAIGHTDVPDTFRDFFGQRLRWDGDLFYLYIRKHFLSFNPRLLGWKNMIMQMWVGILFQIVLPFVILFYTCYIFTAYPVGFVLAVWALVYLVYLLITLTFYLVSVFLISERPRQDLRLAPFVPLMPVFTFFVRIWAAVACLKELFMKSHLDTTMAPWWVLKKTKY